MTAPTATPVRTLNLADLAREAENDLPLESLDLIVSDTLTLTLRHPLALDGPAQDDLFEAITTLGSIGEKSDTTSVREIRAKLVDALATTVEDREAALSVFSKFGIREAAALLRHYVAKVNPTGEASASPAS